MLALTGHRRAVLHGPQAWSLSPDTLPSPPSPAASPSTGSTAGRQAPLCVTGWVQTVLGRGSWDWEGSACSPPVLPAGGRQPSPGSFEMWIPTHSCTCVEQTPLCPTRNREQVLPVPGRGRGGPCCRLGVLSRALSPSEPPRLTVLSRPFYLTRTCLVVSRKWEPVVVTTARPPGGRGAAKALLPA